MRGLDICKQMPAEIMGLDDRLDETHASLYTLMAIVFARAATKFNNSHEQK